MPRFQSLEECQQIVINDIKKISDKYKNFDDKNRYNKIINPWKRMVVGILSCDRTDLAGYKTDLADSIAMATVNGYGYAQARPQVQLHTYTRIHTRTHAHARSCTRNHTHRFV